MSFPVHTRTWHHVRYREEKYVDNTQKIIGGVDGGYSSWYAYADGKPLGDYISEEAAKRAVESYWEGKP